MLFNSWVFAIFFAAFLPFFWAVRHHVRARNSVFLVASYIFYGWWNPRFVPLLAILAAVDYMAALGATRNVVTARDRWKGALFSVATAGACAPFCGADGPWLITVVATCIGSVMLASVLIERAPEDGRPALWVKLSIFANLGVLGFFKYFNFFVASTRDAMGLIGWQVDAVTLNIILPVGLSFHVFQGISRTLDCYRGTVRPEGSLTTVATYLAFFPQLVAGPIERASHLIPQFEAPRLVTRPMITTGALLFVWGLFQKIVIADNVAPVADIAFGNTAALDGSTALAGILAFTVQIYCDFCGYSNMARGLARILGFDLMANFDFPYFSRTPSEFWRRWHISLSTWLRDYLYIALGGNRRGPVHTYRNLALTMLLGGLWHGAAWTFVAWGAFHGGILVIYRLLGIDAALDRLPASSPRGALTHLVAWFVMLVLVMIGWVFFRATSFADAYNVLHAAATGAYQWTGELARVLWYSLPLIVVECEQRSRGRSEALAIRPFLLRHTATVVVVMAILLLSAPTGHAFIYFDF